MYLTLSTLRVCPLYVYRHFSRWLRMRGNPAGTLKVATLPRVRTLDHTNPRRGLRGAPKSCNFTSRSVAGPRQSMVRVAWDAEKLEKVATLLRVRSLDYANPWEGLRGTPKSWKKLQIYLAFARSTTPIHGKACAGRRKVGKKCNFTSRSVARPGESMVRGAFPIDGVGAGSSFRTNDVNTEM